MKFSSHPLLTIIALAVFVFAGLSSNAQDDKSKRPSPPAKATAVVGKTTVTIEYSQPSVKGRKVWGELVPYDKVWRTGANEATTFEVSSAVKVEGKDLPAGKYSLYTIPGESEWVIIFNKEPNQWGAYNYDASKDALRVNVKPGKSSEMTELLTFMVGKDGMVALTWENLKVEFKVEGSK
jgi:hypothetical protein